MAVDEARQQAERGVPGSMEGHAAMAVAGLTIELAFGAAGLVPRERAALVVEPRVTLNYTTGLNVLSWRSLRASWFASSGRTV